LKFCDSDCESEDDCDSCKQKKVENGEPPLEEDSSEDDTESEDDDMENPTSPQSTSLLSETHETSPDQV
jgi:hypothetical protein